MAEHIVTLKTCQGFQKFVRLADGSLKPYHEHLPASSSPAAYPLFVPARSAGQSEDRDKTRREMDL